MSNAVIDVVVPEDGRVIENEDEKVEHFYIPRSCKRQVAKMWPV